MSIMTDGQIKAAIRLGRLSVHPFNPQHVGPASLDLVLDSQFTRINPFKTQGSIRTDSPMEYDTVVMSQYVLPPKQFILASTVERIGFPADIGGDISGRSSIGRLGLFVENAGWVDPGFQGNLTLELYNSNEYPIVLVAGTRIAQIKFIQLSEPCQKPYAGKYQGKYSMGAVGSRAFEDK